MKVGMAARPGGAPMKIMPQPGRRGVLAGAAALALRAGSAWAQADEAGNYPDHPIRLIVPFAPGGGGDTLARLATLPAQALLKQPIVVENRAGAGGNIGAEAAARSPADGYTLLYGTNGTHGINEALYPRLPFRPDADFTPVAGLTRIVLMLVVRNSLPVQTGPELIKYLKANPGKVTYASAGNGTTGHIASEMFRAAAGVDIVHVPYRGNAAALSDLAAGRVDMEIDLIPATFPLVQGGLVRALAVTSIQPVPSLPELPTIDSFLPGFEVSAWDGIFAPAGTPAPIVRKLNAIFTEALKDRDTLAKLRERAAEPAPSQTPEEFAAFVARERVKWASAVRASGARMD